MRLLALASMLTQLGGNPDPGPALTFDDALALAVKQQCGADCVESAGATSDRLASEIASLRRSRLPSVRAEVTGNASRTLDLFAEGPLEVRFASSVLAFDYPLWDGGATSSRINAVEARLRRNESRGRLNDARFNQLLDAFGDLYLVQKQTNVIRPLAEQLDKDAERSAQLLESGEISNLIAAERREASLALRSRVLELEARRVDAAGRLRLLTGTPSEPMLSLNLAEPAPVGSIEKVTDDIVEATTVAVDESRARLRDARASAGLRSTLSGFAGIGAAESDFRSISSSGSYGVYGLRIHLSLPLLPGASGISIAEARASLEASLAAKDAAVDAARMRASEYRLRQETAAQRTTLLEESVKAAREREESLQRLIAGGLRTESDLVQAQSERIRRELDLLAAQIDRWKAARLLARMTGGPEQP